MSWIDIEEELKRVYKPSAVYKDGEFGKPLVYCVREFSDGKVTSPRVCQSYLNTLDRNRHFYRCKYCQLPKIYQKVY